MFLEKIGLKGLNLCWKLSGMKDGEAPIRSYSSSERTTRIEALDAIIMCRLRTGHFELSRGFLRGLEPHIFVERGTPTGVTYILVDCQKFSFFRRKKNLY